MDNECKADSERIVCDSALRDSTGKEFVLGDHVFEIEPYYITDLRFRTLDATKEWLEENACESAEIYEYKFTGHPGTCQSETFVEKTEWYCGISTERHG